MTLQEQFTRLLEKERENEVLPFFKALDLEQRKSLVPHIKKLAKEYADFVPQTFLGLATSSYRQKASQTQARILQVASFVCFTRSDYEKAPFGHLLDEERLNTLLDWYCPSWFNEYINRYSQLDYVPYFLRYGWLMELADRGYVQPTPELIAKVLPQALFETGSHQWVYRPENLLKRETTLTEHLWYLFELDSTIHWYSRYPWHYGQSASENKGWMDFLKNLSAEGTINRDRLLKESILATTRNFNKALSGWFAELFIQLAPTEAELLAMQPELFIAFNSPHGKPITTVLGYCKTLSASDAFQTDDFLDSTPLLLTSKTKTTVTAVLLILEKLAKRLPEKREALCTAACGALIHADDALQTKAAKLIRQYGNPASAPLRDTLAQYTDSLLANARTTLSALLTPPPAPEATTQPFLPASNRARLCPERELPPLENFDELLYLATQAFDNNQPYHFDLLPAALIRLQNQLCGKNIAKLEPAFQRAYQLLLNGGTSNTGLLDQLLATFFVEYARWLIGAFPRETESIRALHETYTRKDEANKNQWSFYTLRIGNLTDWTAYEKASGYEPHKRLLVDALAKLRTQCTLPLLSTPTHAPGWIDPVVLVDRLEAYKLQGVEPGEMDFQLALSRCALERTQEALRAVRQKLTGEYLRLMQFLLSEQAAPVGPFTREVAWAVAGLTKSPGKLYEEFAGFACYTLPHSYRTGQFSWKTVSEPCSYDRYDYASRQTVKEFYARKTLQFEASEVKKKEAGLGTLLSKWLSPEQTEPRLLYELLRSKSSYLAVHDSDCRRLLLLTPNHPEPFLAQVVQKSLSDGDTSGDTGKKTLIETLQTLHGIWNQVGEMAHLFLATCMLSGSKTVGTFAAQIWIEGVKAGSINSELIGEILGKHQRVAFAPTKRLTDLLLDTLFRVSADHNQALENLLTSLLSQLPERPVTGLKKLLEIYLEVVYLNQSCISNQQLLDRLAGWKTFSTLKKVAQALEAKGMVKQAA